MSFISEFKNNLFFINEDNFNDSSLEVYKYQFHQNEVYNAYCRSLKRTPSSVRSINDIPFLPIQFFKSHRVICSKANVEKIFQSSGTTAQTRSKHHIADLNFYHEIAKKTFEDTFGILSEKKLMALLPSYLEQGDSSLISMIDAFIQYTTPDSGYFLGKEIEHELRKPGYKILFGVSFALLDLKLRDEFKDVTIIETGGMKGRRKEITRLELHEKINRNTGIKEIWSEYGMTELQSQAYGKNGDFNFPSWCKILIREVNDPFNYVVNSRIGGINVIDLANIESCSFIETQDLGKMSNDNTFQVLGRLDNSDVRGCNLLV